jgi:TIR domain
MAKLFLSYRRHDTGAYADRLAKRLGAFHFESVFQDREDIALADNYADRIRTELSQCEAVLVLIGSGWTDARGADGRRRLDDSTDLVRREVGLGLQMGKKVIPVLFDSARVPSAADLPRELAALATAQGYDINGNYFDRDVDDFARRLEATIAAAAPREPERAPLMSAALVRQLKNIWVTLFAVTVLVSIAPVFVPAVPWLFWLLPGTMTLAAFLWWLYWLGELVRPPRWRAV